jgi:hypothetical protein
MQVFTMDFIKGISDNKEHFDLSNFPKEHPLFDNRNKAVPGKNEG